MAVVHSTGTEDDGVSYFCIEIQQRLRRILDISIVHMDSRFYNSAYREKFCIGLIKPNKRTAHSGQIMGRWYPVYY